MHIACTDIQRDGSRLQLLKTDFYNSKRATMELEQDHSLRPAGMGILDRKWLLDLPLRKDTRRCGIGRVYRQERLIAYFTPGKRDSWAWHDFFI